MKRMHYLMPVIILLCLACNKHNDEPTKTENIFEADIDGKHWQADSAGAAFIYISSNYGANFFQLAGSSSNGQSFHLTTKSEAPSEATFALTLVSFNVSFDLPNSNGILLTWKTANELNTDHFEIERSRDAASFSKVGELKSAGNSSTLISYQWHDKPPLSGLNYYRLKSVDKDSRSTYSQVVVISSPFGQLYFSSASDTAYHFGFNGNVVLTNNDTVTKHITGTFQFDFIDDGTSIKHTVRNGKFTNLAY